MSLNSGYPSQLDIFYRSNAALKTWFQFWLSLETADYFVMPMPACAQLINAVTMLSRWAKLSGPDPGHIPATAPSSEIQNVRTSVTPSPAQEIMYQHPDPAVPAAVSVIKTHFLAQPDLQIDILGILQAMAVRFEGARRDVASQQGVEWENNMWELAARKIHLTRLKLERWADIVASIGGETLLGKRNGVSDDAVTSGGKPGLVEPSSEKMSYPGGCLDIHAHTLAHVPQSHITHSDHGDSTTQPFQTGWQPTPAFANDLFEDLGLDQSFFFDDPGDYGTVVLNSLGLSNI